MVNKLTDGSNLIWESSRMILPEHKARLREHELASLPVDPPILSEDQQAEIEYNLRCALHNQREVTITFYKDKQIIHSFGRALRLTLNQQALELEVDDGLDWIPLKDIITLQL